MPEKKNPLRTADLERNIAETAAIAARVKASADKLQNTVHKVEEKAEQLHTRIRNEREDVNQGASKVVRESTKSYRSLRKLRKTIAFGQAELFQML